MYSGTYFNYAFMNEFNLKLDNDKLIEMQSKLPFFGNLDALYFLKYAYKNLWKLWVVRSASPQYEFDIKEARFEGVKCRYTKMEISVGACLGWSNVPPDQFLWRSDLGNTKKNLGISEDIPKIWNALLQMWYIWSYTRYKCGIKWYKCRYFMV